MADQDGVEQDATQLDVDHQWFYCLQHHRAEQGQQCPARNRLGPMPPDWPILSPGPPP